MKLLTPQFVVALIGSLFRQIPDRLRGWAYLVLVVVAVGFLGWSLIEGRIGLEQLGAAVLALYGGMSKSNGPSARKKPLPK